MHRPGRCKSALLCLALPLLGPSGVTAQEQRSPILGLEQLQDGASTLLDADLGSAELSVQALGSWDASFGLAGGLVLSGDGEERGLSVTSGAAGLSPELLVNRVDLLLSLLLLERYFLEASLLEDSGFREYSLGYQSDTGLLRLVELGLRERSLPAFAGISGGGGLHPGAQLRLESERFVAEASVQLQSSEEQSAVWIDGRRITEIQLSGDDLLSNRDFLLPDAPVTEVRVYEAQSTPSPPSTGDPVILAADDGRAYRELERGPDFSIDEANGVLVLAELADSRILVSYRNADGTGPGEGGSPIPSGVPDVSGGDYVIESLLPFSRGSALADAIAQVASGDSGASSELLFTSIAGEPALVLYDPALSLPFAARRRAELDLPVVPGESLSAQVSVQGSSAELPVRRAQQDLLFGPTEAGRETEDRLPLPGDDIPDGAPAELGRLLSALELLVRQSLPPGPLVLGPGVRPGSVRILRNGTAETRFTLDPARGEIVPGWNPAPGERLEVRWEQIGDVGPATTLRAAGGARWSIPDELGSVEVGLAADIPFGEGGYQPVSSAQARVLRAASSASLSGERRGWEWELGLRADGLLSGAGAPFVQLLGLDSGIIETGISYASLGPGSVPSSGLPGFPAPSGGTRAIPLTSALSDLQSAPPNLESVGRESAAVPAEGGLAGTGIARVAIDGVSRLVAVLDADLGPSATWSSVQWSLGGADFSTVSAVELDLLVDGVDEVARSDLGVFLDLGLLTEDRDADGLLDREESDSSGGWDWDFGGTSYRFPSGGAGNGLRDGEDSNGNLALDREQRTSFVRLELPVPDDASWDTLLLELDEAARRTLARAHSVRLTVQSRGTADGLRIAMSAPRLVLGIPKDQTADQTLLLASAPDTSPPDSLPGPAADPAVLQAAGSGGALRVSWTALDQPDNALLSLPLSWGASAGGSLGFYLLLEAGLGGGTDSLEIRIQDGEGNRIQLAVPQSIRSASEWVNVRISLEDGQGVFTRPDGSTVTAGSVFFPAESTGTGVPAGIGASVGTPGSLGLVVSSGGSGSLVIDEVYATAVASAVAASADLGIRLSRQGSILRVGGTDILRDPRLSLDAIAGGSGSGNGGASTDSGLSAAADLGLPGLRLGVNAALVAGAGLREAGASVRLDVPETDSLWLLDGGARSAWAADGAALFAADAGIRRASVALTLATQLSAGPSAASRSISVGAEAGPFRTTLRSLASGAQGLVASDPWPDLRVLLSGLADSSPPDLLTRDLGADAELRLGSDGPRLLVTPKASLLRVEGDRRAYAGSLSASASIPAGLGRLSLEAGRALQGTDGAPDSGQPEAASDLAAAAAWFGAWTGQSLPGLISLNPLPPARGPEALLEDELGLQFTRPLGRELRDLLIPQVAEFSLGKSIGRALDTAVGSAGVTSGVQGATVLLRARAENRESWRGFSSLQLRSGMTAGVSGPGGLSSALADPESGELSGRVLAEAEGNEAGIATLDLEGALGFGTSTRFSGTLMARRVLRDQAARSVELPGSLGALAIREREIQVAAELQARPGDESRDARLQLDWEQRITDGLLSSAGWSVSAAVQEARLGSADPGTLEFGISARVFARISF